MIRRGELVVDLFAGGGGASRGLEALGLTVDVAVNHWPQAIEVHEWNHPYTRHHTCDVYEVDPREATGGNPVGVLWASPDCTYHSRARGGKPLRGPNVQKIRGLADVVVRWARAVAPRFIFVENVPEFVEWGPLVETAEGWVRDKTRKGETFARWVADLQALGYSVDWRVLDSADYGAPTRRRRLFVVARRDGAPIAWPEATHGDADELLPFASAGECVDWSLPCPSIFLSKEEGRKVGARRPLAEKTMSRIAEGVRRFVIETDRPYIVQTNHGGGFRGQSLDDPLPTITAARRGLALVRPTIVGAALLNTRNGEAPGQRPRVRSLADPAPTVTAAGSQGAVMAAFLAKHYGGGNERGVGQRLDVPQGTITARDSSGPVAATLLKMRGGTEAHVRASGVDPRGPLGTLTAGGFHVAEVRAFLTAYYGTGCGQNLNDPARTITARDRLALGVVLIGGEPFQIVDIGMRMLQPHELLRAQFGRHAEGYSLDPASSKADRVRLIGNSVPPDVVRALVGANLFPRTQKEAA